MSIPIPREWAPTADSPQRATRLSQSLTVDDDALTAFDVKPPTAAATPAAAMA